MSNERFIPFSKKDIIELCNQHAPSSFDSDSFRQFSAILSATLHYQYHSLLENLKDAYAPFDPNKDTRLLTDYSQTQITEKQNLFADYFTQVLTAANFEQITESDLQEALHEKSLFDVNLVVNFDDFEQVVFYGRGRSHKSETLRHWFGFKKETISFTNYDKVAIYIKFKDQHYFCQKKHKPVGIEPGSTIIKLFQNVPKADLEMLFPNSEVAMRPIDKFIIGASALIGGSIVIITKLGASLILLASLFAYWLGLNDNEVTMTQSQLVALLIGFGVFCGFVFKEWNKFKNRKIRFMKLLADNLYFKNLDNNAGVFHTLIDAAEDEDFKEAILAYYFLLIAEQPLTTEALDNTIEQWFRQHQQCDIDFDVHDALTKLLTLALIEKTDIGYTALPLAVAKQSLDNRWDSLFSFNKLS